MQESHDAPAALAKAAELNDTAVVRRKGRMMLPAPQISEVELEAIARMSTDALLDEQVGGCGLYSTSWCRMAECSTMQYSTEQYRTEQSWAWQAGMNNWVGVDRGCGDLVCVQWQILDAVAVSTAVRHGASEPASE